MAEEKISIYKVGIEAKESIETIADLKSNIKLLKEQLASTTIGTKEYKDTLEELKINQNALRDSMYATTASLEDISAAATGTGESYNSLVHLMANLKEELRATDVSTEAGKQRFEELAGQIRNVNDRLKEMDAAQGNFQRNVGNYEGSLKKWSDGFSRTAGSAGSVINPVKNLTLGFKALSATPVIGILGLVANALNLIIGGLKTSEENTNAMTKAFSSLSAIGDVVKRVMQALGTAIASVAGAFNNLLEKVFPKLAAMSEERRATMQKEIDLVNKQREATTKNAEAELEIAKLKNEAADKETHSAEERIALLQKAADLELDIMQRNKDIAKLEYEIAEENAKRAGNSKEENDAKARAYANMIQTETAYFNKSKELTKQISAARKQERQEAEAAVKAERQLREQQTVEERKRREAEQEALEAAIEAEQKARNREIEIDKEFWTHRLSIAMKGSEEEFSARQAILEDEYQLAKAKAEQDIADAEERAKSLELIELSFAEKRARLEEAFAEQQRHEAILRMKNDRDELEKGSEEYLEKQIELKLFELDTLHQLETESDEEFRSRQLAAQEAYNEAVNALEDKQLEEEKDRAEERIETLMSVADATAAIMGNIADIFSANSNVSETMAKQMKNLKIAEATVETIKGAIAAYMNSVAYYKNPAKGIAMGIVNAATVTTAGLANIMKIKNTNVSRNASSATSATSANAVVQAPAQETEVQNVRSVTTSTEEERLNQMAGEQRVVLVMSDLEIKQNQVKVQTEESSF